MTDETLTTTQPPGSATENTAPDHGPRDRLAVRLLLISTFVVILNETIMGVALPHLMTDLDIPASTAQWVTTAFMLTMAVVIPVTGFVIQRFTTRTTYITAMTLFILPPLRSNRRCTCPDYQQAPAASGTRRHTEQ